LKSILKCKKLYRINTIMTAPLDQAMEEEIKNCVRKEFTVYYKNDGILYRKTTTRDFMSNNDFIDSTRVISLGKTDA